MSFNVFSVDFFKNIAQAKADENYNGIIDKEEKSIFDEEFKKFDVNNDGIVDEKDVQQLQKKFEVPQKEIERELELNKQREEFEHLNYNPNNQKHVKEFERLYSALYIARCEFVKEIAETIEYLAIRKKVVFDRLYDRYNHAIRKILPDKTTINVKVGNHLMNGLVKAVTDLIARFKGSNENKNDGLDLSAYIINVADKIPDNLEIQEKSLSLLEDLAAVGIENNELIEDLKNRIKEIKKE